MDSIKYLDENIASTVITLTSEDLHQIEEAYSKIRSPRRLSFRAGALLLTPPASQSTALLASCADRWASEIISALNCVDYDPCFALLVTIDGAGRVPPPGYVRLDRGPIEWIADNTQKEFPRELRLSRSTPYRFLSEPSELPKEDVARLLLEAAEPWLAGRVNAWQLHRWRYSRPVAVGGPNLEGAFLSGLASAERLAKTAN